MTELKSLIKKEFLPVLSPYDFMVYKNNLVIKPVGDLLRGFCFDRHDDSLYVELFIQPLYVPIQYMFLDYGWRLRDSQKSSEIFWLKEGQIEHSIFEIKRLLLSEKDILLETNTALDFYNKFLISDLKLSVYKTEINIRYQETLTLTQAYIYPEKTCILVDDFLKKWEKDDRKNVAWMQEIKNNMLLLKQNCASKEKIRELLTEWKGFTTEKLKLVKVK